MLKYLIIPLLAITTASAQNVNEILKQIEQNNPTLKALTAQAEADKLTNRTSIGLPDPEVELGFLNGKPTGTGRRTDLKIAQPLDLATLSGARLRAARKRNELLYLNLLTERTAILLEAKQLCIEIDYCNRAVSWLNLRYRDAVQLVRIYEGRVESGDASWLELDKFRTEQASSRDAFLRTVAERNGYVSRLTQLNGGQGFNFETIALIEPTLPNDFEPWWGVISTFHPTLIAAQKATESAHRQTQLAKTEGLPQLTVGYMREKTLGQRYEGATVGMNIPLWSNRNRVKAAKAAETAAALNAKDRDIQLREKLRALLQNVHTLRLSLAEWSSLGHSNNSLELLRKALEVGEISTTDYLVNSRYLNDASLQYAQIYRDFHLAAAELLAFEL